MPELTLSQHRYGYRCKQPESTEDKAAGNGMLAGFVVYGFKPVQPFLKG
jgi:hypothetical protein